MKKRTWLFVIVLIVFVINVSFFILVRMAKVDKIAQAQISNHLSKLLNADIKMEEFDINDNQANVTGLEISSTGKFDLKVEQIYVEYNLIQLLFSRFKNLKAIKHIKIYEPKLSLEIELKEKSEESGEFQIPDLTQFFKMLDIYDGELSVDLNSETIKFSNSWQNIDLKIENKKSSDIKLSAVSQDSSNLDAACILKKGNIINAELQIGDLKPSHLEIEPLENLEFMLNADVQYQLEKLQYSLNVSAIKTQFKNMKAAIDSVTFTGNEEKANLQLHNAFADGNKITGNALVDKILSKDRSINSKISINKIPINRYISSVSGELNTSFEVSGELSDPFIKAKVTSEQIIAAGQKIKDVRVNADMKNDHIKIRLDSSYWEDNLFTGTGYYNIGSDLNFDVISNDLLWRKGGFEIGGDLTTNISYEDELEAFANIDSIYIRSKTLQFNDLSLKMNLSGNDLTADLYHPLNDINLSCIGNIENKELSAKLKLNSLDLTEPLNGSALPILNGNVSVSANEYSIVLNSNIIVYDKDYGKLGGKINTDIVLDLSNKRSLINLRTFKARYNYEPFKIDLLANGTLDSLSIQHFQLNKMININGWIKRKPLFTYNMNLDGNNLKLKQLAKYFVDFDTSQQLDGEANINLKVTNVDQGEIEGYLNIDDFEFGGIDQINAGISFSGDNSMISIKEGSVFKKSDELLGLQGALILKPDLMITATGSIDSVNISEFLPESNLKGLLNGGVEFSRINSEDEFQLDLAVDNLKYNHFKADLLNFDILQKDSLLHVNSIRCFKRDEFDLSVSGAIGYNVMNSLVFSDSNTISVMFNGDLLKMLSDQTKAIISGRSKAGFNFKIGTRESKIFVEEGRFDLQNGYLKIEGQPEDIDKIAINLNINDNILSIDKFKFRMGEGRCYISNVITETIDDFILGTLNMGKILVKTNEGGLLFNMPGYIPANNVAKVIIKGRGSEFFEVKGPFEDMSMIGDINISNGSAIFPPNTENLLKLFNTVREKKTSEIAPLPLSFDIMVNFGENVKYVTYPVDLKITPGGYLNIVYDKEEFTIPDALFIAEEGTVDIFGTKMKLDYLQIQLSKFTGGAKISGTFYKKTADGSLITLNIYNEVTENDDLGTLRFSLNSDNPTDRITDILAKLRYNRAMDEISADQKKTLLQDEFIQIAGMGLESAVMDPLLSPVENWIRKTLNLDYFHLQTDLVQNLFASYASDDKSQYEVVDEEDEFAKFSSELFLNNLSISMGRYITRDLFLDYETRVEKSQDIVLRSEMGVFHEFSLRYQLPYKFRILYKYKILPFTEENPHEIMLERSFRF